MSVNDKPMSFAQFMAEQEFLDHAFHSPWDYCDECGHRPPGLEDKP